MNMLGAWLNMSLHSALLIRAVSLIYPLFLKMNIFCTTNDTSSHSFSLNTAYEMVPKKIFHSKI